LTSGNPQQQNQRGAALIFAILISLLLSVLAVFFTAQSRLHIHTANQLADKLEARLAAKSQFAETVYAISNLNYQVVQWPTESEWQPMATYSRWYERGEGMRVYIQDLASRPSLVPMERREWQSYLMNYGLTDLDASAFLDKLEDWMDSDSFRRLQGLEVRGYQMLNSGIMPRNAPMQSLEELLWIPGMTRTLYDVLAPALSYWGTSNRSPLAGSAEMISAYYGAERLDELMALRSTPSSARAAYNQLTGVDVTRVNDMSSGLFRLEIESKVGQAQAKLVTEVDASGNDTFPFYVVSWK
jgi:type II secretory pathway component PulK